MSSLLIDTSILIKWFHGAGESELAEARALRRAHVAGEIDAHLLDLAYYEVGNVLVRPLGWAAGDVADQLDDLRAICGTPLVMDPAWLRLAAQLAVQHKLTFYDASWAAAAQALALPLVSADRALLGADLAESTSSFVRRLDLPIS